MKYLNKSLQLEEKQIKIFLDESINNNLLKDASLLSSYYLKYRSSFPVAIIPALGNDSKHAYFSCPLKIEDNSRRLSPVFLIDNTDIINKYGISLFEKNDDNYFNFHNTYFFVFDSEDIFNTKTDITYQNLMKEHILSHPYIAFFQGCDDGHVGMRFKTKEDFFDFIKSIEIFEDIFDFHTSSNTNLHNRLEFHN